MSVTHAPGRGESICFWEGQGGDIQRMGEGVALIMLLPMVGCSV